MEIESCIPSSTISPHLKSIILDLIELPLLPLTQKTWTNMQIQYARKYKCIVGKHELWSAYRDLNRIDPLRYPMLESLRISLLKKAIRSASGIVNISVILPPHRFSCKYNCKFCPDETRANGADVDMPRSYLSNEDAVARGASVDFDAIRQVQVRFDALERNGHPIDKIEFRILGGTFSCYPHDVTHTFIRDLYYAANTYHTAVQRSPMTLDAEIAANETAHVHVVGVGVETRPDEITVAEVRRFRTYGITRVELGLQHTNDELLRRVNRGHGIKASKAAIKLLKDCGFKIEMHIMTDLPGTTPELDKECYRLVLKDDPDIIPDYLKDYPCLDVSFTEIKKWKADGRWTPYAELDGGKHLHDVLIYRQSITPSYVRVNRIQRDFHAVSCSNSLGFTSSTLQSNLGDAVTRMAEARGIYCQCIRCCEVRYMDFNPADIQYCMQSFAASGGIEYFISAILPKQPKQYRNTLLGFLRLRLTPATLTSCIPELRGRTALIRELHVYGHVKPVGSIGRIGAQHMGIGARLLNMAETIVSSHSEQYDRMAIIAGVGVRDYYRKHGYACIGTYMIKTLPLKNTFRNTVLLYLICLCIIILFVRHIHRWNNTV